MSTSANDDGPVSKVYKTGHYDTRVQADMPQINLNVLLSETFLLFCCFSLKFLKNNVSSCFFFKSVFIQLITKRRWNKDLEDLTLELRPEGYTMVQQNAQKKLTPQSETKKAY